MEIFEFDDFLVKEDSASSGGGNSQTPKRKFGFFDRRSENYQMLYFFYPKILSNEAHFHNKHFVGCKGDGCELCDNFPEGKGSKQEICATYILTKKGTEFEIQILSLSPFLMKLIGKENSKVDNDEAILCVKRNPESSKLEFKSYVYTEKFNKELFEETIQEKFTFSYEGEDFDILAETIGAESKFKNTNTSSKSSSKAAPEKKKSTRVVEEPDF